MIRLVLLERGLGVCALAELLDCNYRTARRIVTEPLKCLAQVRRLELAVGQPIISPPDLWLQHQTAAKFLGSDPLLLPKKELKQWLAARRIRVGRLRNKEDLIARILENSAKPDPL